MAEVAGSYLSSSLTYGTFSRPKAMEAAEEQVLLNRPYGV